MPRPIHRLPQIRTALRFYRALAYITGTFLLLLVVEMVLKYSPTHVELFVGAQGLQLAPVVPLPECRWYSLFVPGGMGCEIESTGVGFNLSLAILIVHGWIYVAYLLASGRLWMLLRWPFGRIVAMALGGVVPFLSFFVERRMHAIAAADLARLEGEKAAADAAKRSASESMNATAASAMPSRTSTQEA